MSADAVANVVETSATVATATATTTRRRLKNLNTSLIATTLNVLPALMG